jgi:hypothetical protein
VYEGSFSILRGFTKVKIHKWKISKDLFSKTGESREKRRREEAPFASQAGAGSRDTLSEPAVGLCLSSLELFSQGPCLCELVSGLVRKPDVQKNSIQGSQMASCPSDVNKKVTLNVCFFCFSVLILKET